MMISNEKQWEKCPINEQVFLYQDKEHFRFTSDSVLLAAFCRAGKGSRCVDLGAGQGILALSLFARYGVQSVEAVELRPELCEMMEKTAKENGLNGFHIICGDLRDPSLPLPAGKFDLVISNPPYRPLGQGALSSSSVRAAAVSETECRLEDVFAAAMRALRFGGRFCLCMRPDRLGETVLLASRFGGEVKRLRFVHSYSGKEASLALIEIRRGGKPGLRVEPPIVFYEKPGEESPVIKRIYAGENL